MALQIGQKSDSSFAEPLGLLSDCHRRIEKFLDQMIAVTATADGGALTGVQREAMEAALLYFDRAAPLHTQDEEISLFPRIRAAGSDEANRAFAAVDALESDHRDAEAAHAEIDSAGRGWLETGAVDDAARARLLNQLRELREMYARHISVEDDIIFPLAGRLLEKQDLAQAGREMAMRRGINPDVLPAALPRREHKSPIGLRAKL